MPRIKPGPLGEMQKCYLCVQRAVPTVRLQMSRDAFGEVFEEGAVEVDLGLSADVWEHEDHLREAGLETRIRTKLLDDLVAVGDKTWALFSPIIFSFFRQTLSSNRFWR